jgi:hypothetical protein
MNILSLALLAMAGVTVDGQVRAYHRSLIVVVCCIHDVWSVTFRSMGLTLNALMDSINIPGSTSLRFRTKL